MYLIPRKSNFPENFPKSVFSNNHFAANTPLCQGNSTIFYIIPNLFSANFLSMSVTEDAFVHHFGNGVGTHSLGVGNHREMIDAFKIIFF
jgi:hypothetical protein